MVILKSTREIDKMKKAGEIVAAVFEVIRPRVVPGISTLELDALIYKTIVSHGAEPSFLNYGRPPFPASACISINEEVVHGIPRADRILRDGDIVSVDVGAYHNGFHADACRSFLCGSVSPEWQMLVQVTEEAFWLGVREARVGNRLGDISHAVQSHVESYGYGVVRELTGHGIGRNLHEAPDLLNYGQAGHGIRLQAGLCLALEPMVTLKSPQIRLCPDQWTMVTADGEAAAHYENSFAMTEEGPLLLTCPDKKFMINDSRSKGGV